MIKEAIEKLNELTRNADKTVIGQDGKEYSFNKLTPVYDDPRPEPLKVYSLTGILDYMKSNVDGLSAEKLIIHVVNHERVDLLTNVHGEKNQRHIVLSAVLDGNQFKFERYMDQEEFIIRLRSMFQETADRDYLLQYTSRIDADSTVNTTDDGITQQVNIKQGIRSAMVEAADLKPIVSMKPFRTFRELDQPESQFLFRTQNKSGVEAALFEADGGTWKNEARKRIAEFLKPSGIAIIS